MVAVRRVQDEVGTLGSRSLRMLRELVVVVVAGGSWEFSTGGLGSGSRYTTSRLVASRSPMGRGLISMIPEEAADTTDGVRGGVETWG